MELNISDAIDVIDRIVESNYKLKKDNSTAQRIAIEMVGQHGLGKSQSIEEFAKSKGYAFVKKELAQITDETSLFGYPRQTYSIHKKVQTKNEKGEIKESIRTKNIHINELETYTKAGWTQKSKDSQLTYSIPEWVETLNTTPKSVLLLDELNRSLPLIQAATMNLVLDGKYGNWSLPPGCTIILSNNPNTGDYNVTELDDAGKDRKFSIHLKPDINSWVLWASKNQIKDECINFLYKCPEVRDTTDKPSYRRWTQFFNAIKDCNLKSTDDLDYVYKIGSISVGEGNLLIFKNFISNNLDMLPSIAEIFDENKKISEQVALLNKCIYYLNDQNQYVLRTDIIGLLGLRIKGYFKSNSIRKSHVERFQALCYQNIIPKDSIIDILTDMSKKDHPNKSQLGYLLTIPSVNELLLSVGKLNI